MAACTLIPRCSPLGLVRLWCGGRVVARDRRAVGFAVKVCAEELLGRFERAREWGVVEDAERLHRAEKHGR